MVVDAAILNCCPPTSFTISSITHAIREYFSKNTLSVGGFPIMSEIAIIITRRTPDTAGQQQHGAVAKHNVNNCSSIALHFQTAAQFISSHRVKYRTSAALPLTTISCKLLPWLPLHELYMPAEHKDEPNSTVGLWINRLPLQMEQMTQQKDA